MSVARGIMGRVFRSGRPELVKDVRADPDFVGAIEGLVSEICIPLFDEGTPVGALNVESTNGVVMGEDDLRLIDGAGRAREHCLLEGAPVRGGAQQRGAVPRPGGDSR